VTQLRCPTCGQQITETDKTYACNCVTIPKEILQQKITPEIVKELITDRRTRVLDGFISKKNGKRFSATLVIRDNRVAFEFDDNEKTGRQEDVTKQIGKGDVVNIKRNRLNDGRLFM
jgi:DNA topoisomerase-3